MTTGSGAKPPLRILFLPILFYPDTWNGIMEHLRLLIDHLDRQRYEPIIAVRPGDGPQTATLAERTGACVCTLPPKVGPAQIRALCQSERVDLVHIHSPSTGTVAKMALGARLGGASALVTYHLLQPERLRRRSRLVNRLAQQLLVRRTIAVSTGVAWSLAHNSGLDRRHIRVIHNGVEPPADSPPTDLAFPRSDGDVWIGYFGRLAEEKGVNHLVDALALLRPRCPQARAVLVGDGYLREPLQEQTRRLGLEDRVLFAGYRADARAVMREVDVVVLPSLLEGLSMTLIEAMAAGRPVVATDIPGVSSDVVDDGVTGLLVPRSDPPALASALATLIQDPARRAVMGATGQERFVARFQRCQMADAVYAIYADLHTGNR